MKIISLIALPLLGITACFEAGENGKSIDYRSPKAPALQIVSSVDDLSKTSSVSVPADLADLAGQLKIEEGASVVTQSTAAALNVGEATSSAGPSINVSNSGKIDPSQIGRLQISLPFDETIALAESARQLVVMYQVIGADGKVVIGVIPPSSYRADGAFLKFKMVGFGSYQAARVAKEVTEEIKVQTEETKVITKSEQEALPAMTVASLNPIIAKKGDTVRISGSNFRSGLKLAYLGQSLGQVQIESSEIIRVVIADAPRMGLGKIYLAQDGVERSLSLAYAGSAGDFPLITLEATEVCAGQKFYNANGDLLEGSKSCQSAASCTSDGQTGCVVVGPTYAAAVVSGAADKILSGQTLGGVSGNVALPLAAKVVSGTSYGSTGALQTGTLGTCTGDGQSGCVTDANYKSIQVASLTAGSIKSGVTLGGVLGAYPSATYPLAGADATGDLVAFGPSVAAGSYEFFDSAGNRYTGSVADGGTLTANTSDQTLASANTFYRQVIVAGDADLIAANVKDTINILGVSGTHAGSLPNCTAGNAVGCVTTSTYKSIDLSAAGTGTGLSAANFNATIRSSGNFEFWDATGARHSVAGDLDLTAVNVKDAINIFGVTGALTGAPATCANDGDSNCLVDGTNYKAAALAGAASKILSGQTLAGEPGNVALPAAGKVFTGISYGAGGNALTGTLTLPAAANVLTGSVAYGDPGAQLTPSYSPDFPLAANVRDNDTVNGTGGTLEDCSAGNQAGCVTTASYKSIDLSALGSNSSSALTAANFNASLATASNFEFWDATGARHQFTGDADLAAANIANTVVIHGVTGTGSVESHSNCSAANQTGCVATATYKTMDLSGASGTTDLTSANFNATIATAANFEFWDSTGARYQVAGDADLTAAKILDSTDIFGVTGSVLPKPANCSGDGATGCVATISFPAADITGATSKLVFNQTMAGMTGTVHPAPANCSSNGSQSCVATGSYFAGTACAANGSNCFVPSYVVTSQPLKAISYDEIDAGKGSMRTSLSLAGIAGTLNDCSAGNTSGCVTTATYKSMDLSAAGTDTGLTSGNFQTLISTSANSEFWDATGTRHSIAGDADLSPGHIKAGVNILGFAGQYPSSTYRLSTDTGSTDLTLFTTQLTSPGTFEFFDSAGDRYTGSGDSDLVSVNIKNGVDIESLSLNGNYITPLTCPAGWIKVPGDSAYGTAEFCVMKYESKNVTVATSQAASTPWVSITQTAAIDACRALGTGYDLIANPQWMTIGANAAALNGNWSGGTVASGYLVAGHNDNSPASSCEASSNDALFFVETNCTAVSSGDTTEQRRTLTLSNSVVIWDLSGNVNEWVNYVNRGDKPGAANAYYEYSALTGSESTALKALVPTNAVKAFWNDGWNSGQKIGQIYPGTNATGGALFRGGYFADNAYAGVFAASLSNPPSGTFTHTGFRCQTVPSH